MSDFESDIEKLCRFIGCHVARDTVAKLQPLLDDSRRMKDIRDAFGTLKIDSADFSTATMSDWGKFINAVELILKEP